MVFQNKFNVVKYLILFVCFFSLVFSSSANAIVYNTSNYKSVTAASVIFRNGGSVPFTMNTSTGGAYCQVTGFNNSSGFYYLAIAFTNTIPARSLLVVNIETRFSNSYPQMGWTTRSGAYSLLNASYGDYGSESLVFYVDQDITGEIDLFPTVQDSGQTTQLFMTISPISYTTLSFEPTWDQLNEISSKLTTSNGNLQLIRGKLDDIATLLEEQNEAQQDQQEQEQQAQSNIENQSISDIEDSTSQATTNLIGVLSSFLTELQGFSATNCNLSLPFPQFIGGTQIVNICQGKDVLGNFITVVGTLAMVVFYIPLAIVLLKMIYNEIRSFTNG